MTFFFFRACSGLRATLFLVAGTLRLAMALLAVGSTVVGGGSMVARAVLVLSRLPRVARPPRRCVAGALAELCSVSSTVGEMALSRLAPSGVPRFTSPSYIISTSCNLPELALGVLRRGRWSLRSESASRSSAERRSCDRSDPEIVPTGAAWVVISLVGFGDW